jgi:ABC-type uncharacterized transport system substrate-binding protein
MKPIAAVTGIAALMAATGGIVADASAHPHVYVTVESTLLYDNNTITGLRQRWYFDEFYTGMAIEGLDANGDGVFDRKELAELAKVNVDGLSQMDYFTFAKLGEQRLAFDAPKDYFLEHVTLAQPPGSARAMGLTGTPPAGAPPAAKSGFWGSLVGKLTGGDKSAAEQAAKVLALEFTLPLKQPVLAEAQGFEYAISDPQFWIWFDLATDKGATLGPGAPAGCKLDVGLPKQDAADLQKLGEAFFSQTGGAQAGLGIAKTVSLSCPKS